jgi:hypothetical protein
MNKTVPPTANHIILVFSSVLLIITAAKIPATMHANPIIPKMMVIVRAFLLLRFAKWLLNLFNCNYRALFYMSPCSKLEV